MIEQRVKFAVRLEHVSCNQLVREKIHQFAYRDTTRCCCIAKLQRMCYQPLVGLSVNFKSGVMVLGKYGFFIREVLYHMCEQPFQGFVEFVRI